MVSRKGAKLAKFLVSFFAFLAPLREVVFAGNKWDLGCGLAGPYYKRLKISSMFARAIVVLMFLGHRPTMWDSSDKLVSRR